MASIKITATHGNSGPTVNVVRDMVNAYSRGKMTWPQVVDGAVEVTASVHDDDAQALTKFDIEGLLQVQILSSPTLKRRTYRKGA